MRHSSQGVNHKGDDCKLSQVYQSTLDAMVESGKNNIEEYSDFIGLLSDFSDVNDEIMMHHVDKLDFQCNDDGFLNNYEEFSFFSTE